jgi:hypothetical protein
MAAWGGRCGSGVVDLPADVSHTLAGHSVWVDGGLPTPWRIPLEIPRGAPLWRFIGGGIGSFPTGSVQLLHATSSTGTW